MPRLLGHDERNRRIPSVNGTTINAAVIAREWPETKAYGYCFGPADWARVGECAAVLFKLECRAAFKGWEHQHHTYETTCARIATLLAHNVGRWPSPWAVVDRALSGDDLTDPFKAEDY